MDQQQANSMEKEIARLRAALAESQASIHAAMDVAGIYYFEYYPDTDTALEYDGRDQFGLEDRLTDYPESWFAKKITHPEDEAALREAFAAIKRGGDRAGCEVRNLMNGAYRWFRYDFTVVHDAAGRRTKAVCTAQDITGLRKGQEELRENNARYELTTRYAGMSFFTYDIAHDVMYNGEAADRLHPMGRVVPDFVAAAAAAGNIREDSLAEFYSLYDRLCAGAENTTADLWIRKKNGRGWWCERITYVAVPAANGQPDRAYGLGRDVTEFKEAECRLIEEQRYQEGIENDKLLMRTRCDVTADRVETLTVKPEMSLPDPAATFTGGVQQMADHAYTPEDRALVLENLSDEAIRRAALGAGQYAFAYRRRDARGRALWVRTTVRVLQQPGSRHVIAFVNVIDINAEKKYAAIVGRIATIDYEVLAMIYPESDEIECIRADDTPGFRGIDFRLPYSVGVAEFIGRHIEPDRREDARRDFSVAAIRAALEKAPVYRFTYGVDSTNRRKTWAFSYLDETKTAIIYTRTDVTALFAQQETQRIALRDALMQAEEASKAKTNFLSRMSHEIRTPMNAIIGMNALAAQAVDQPDQVRDCLAKVGISARFLLSLINDILDMSRIESGKVTLRNERFPMDELLASINSIIYEQAAQKGIDYDCVISGFAAEHYIGDAMKLQQILVNLLGNSVKFTGAGGKVQLIIRQERVENGRAQMVFSVNDTGVGISPELQKRMFEPFEQGDSTITSPYKGTGLGLAIAKNLVTMMGGTISVNSIEGVGSEFTVRVKLECCPEETGSWDLQTTVPLEKLKTLIVDDDVVICEHTKQLLADMGMRAEWVESGRRAVEKIRKKWGNHEFFDIVLLDWKMPDMDGIETARQIRRIVGDDVTIIVMTAYDWAEIEQEARRAGVNLLVTKPLFKSTLISAFERVFREKREERPQPAEREFDFTGRHILLAEDHILNVEVAKRLLEAKHARVTVAENGLRALELFMEAPEDYYDAILMDIRMPVMDGLTATRSIRQLRRPTAKTIPIIAMSANAFEEDVEKSRAAGINEHLSKPIEPQLMFATLEKWIYRQGHEAGAAEAPAGAKTRE